MFIWVCAGYMNLFFVFGGGHSIVKVEVVFFVHYIKNKKISQKENQKHFKKNSKKLLKSQKKQEKKINKKNRKEE